MLRFSNVVAAVFVVYRPRSSGRKFKPFRVFLEEFGELLEHVSINKTGLIILGDFTTEMKPTRTHVTWLQFSTILPVTGSVLTFVSESLVTDHHVIMCKLVSAKPRPVRKERFYRKYTAMDMKQLAHDLIDSPLVTSSADDIHSLCEHYNVSTSGHNRQACALYPINDK